MVFDVITPQKYKKDHTKQNKPKENFISMQKKYMQGSTYHAPLLSPSRNTISAILSDNPTHIAR